MKIADSPDCVIKPQLVDIADLIFCLIRWKTGRVLGSSQRCFPALSAQREPSKTCPSSSMKVCKASPKTQRSTFAGRSCADATVHCDRAPPWLSLLGAGDDHERCSTPRAPSATPRHGRSPARRARGGAAGAAPAGAGSHAAGDPAGGGAHRRGRQRQDGRGRDVYGAGRRACPCVGGAWPVCRALWSGRSIRSDSGGDGRPLPRPEWGAPRGVATAAGPHLAGADALAAHGRAPDAVARRTARERRASGCCGKGPKCWIR